MSNLSGVARGLGETPRSGSTIAEGHLPAGFYPALEGGELSVGWASASALRRNDIRQGRRRSLRCEMMLIGNVADDVEEPIKIPGQCANVGDGGLYGVVPVGYGVAVGQRYTFELTTCECGPEPDSRQVVAQQGRILRTELLMGPSGTLDRIGIGVRLYGRRTGVISMPTAALDTLW